MTPMATLAGQRASSMGLWAVPVPAEVLQAPVTLATVESFCRAAIDYGRALTRATQPPVRIALHGVDLRVHSAVPGYADVALRRLHKVVNGAPASKLNVVVVSPEAGLIGPPPPWGEAMFSARDLELTLASTPYRASYFHDLRFWQIMDLDAGFGLQWMLDDRALPPWDSGAPLRTFLHWTYGRLGLRLVHAGTLGLNGRGVLITGKGGSGKSGTVTGGIMQGFESVGDDYVLIDKSGAEAVALALFPNLKQDTTGLARLGLSGLIGDKAENWQGKFEFTSVDLGGKPLTDRLVIDAILVARLGSGDGTCIEDLSRAQAMVSLAPTGLFQMPSDRDAGVTFYADLIRRLPAKRITLGRDPRGVNAAIGALLEDLAS